MVLQVIKNWKSGAGRLNAFLLLLLFSLPLGQMPFTNLILVAMFIQALVLYRKADWSYALGSPILWPSAVFYLYFAASLLWSNNSSEGLAQLETKTSFLLVPLFIVAGKNHWRKDLRGVALKVFWWANLVAVLVALVYAAFRAIETGAFYETNEFGRRYYFLYTHLASPLMHPGYLGTYVGMALLSTYFLHDRSKGIWRAIYPLVALLFLVFMILLQARINLIALFAIAALVALWVAIKKRNYWALSVPAAGSILLGLFILFAPADFKKRYLQLPDFSYDISGRDFNSATYRLAEWKCAWSVVEANPIIGTGLGENREALLQAYQDFKFWEGLEKKFNAHNQYLETAVAGGVLGVLSLLLLIGSYARLAWRTGNNLVLVNLSFFALCLLTESMFERIWAVLLFTLFFSLFLLPKESDSSAY